jgi:hypothetical protein
MLGGSNNLPQHEDDFGLRGKQRGERSTKFEEPKSLVFLSSPQQGFQKK